MEAMSLFVPDASEKPASVSLRSGRASRRATAEAPGAASLGAVEFRLMPSGGDFGFSDPHDTPLRPDDTRE